MGICAGIFMAISTSICAGILVGICTSISASACTTSSMSTGVCTSTNAGAISSMSVCMMSTSSSTFVFTSVISSACAHPSTCSFDLCHCCHRSIHSVTVSWHYTSLCATFIFCRCFSLRVSGVFPLMLVFSQLMTSVNHIEGIVP